VKTSIFSLHQEVDDTLKRYVQRRLQSALSTLVTQVQGVTVHLKTQNSAQGVREHACEITVEIKDQPVLVIQRNTSHWLAAIDQAVEAAARALRRLLRSGVTASPVQAHTQLGSQAV